MDGPSGEGVLSQLTAPLPRIFDTLLEASSDAPPQSRADALEISLRHRCLQLLQAVLSYETESMQSLHIYWKDTLHAIHHVVQSSEEEAVGVAINGSVAGVISNEPAATIKASDRSRCLSILPISSHLRKLPVILLDDILDTLTVASGYEFWNAAVPSSLLFGNTLWNTPAQHPCWLSFLKTTNKFLRRLQADESQLLWGSVSASAAAAEILLLLSTVYPMTEKSATRVWGSHNTDHVTELESELEFKGGKGASLTVATSAAAPSSLDFSFYDTFWKLQHDFRNPNGINVADFLRRLNAVLHTLESHPVAAGRTTGTDTLDAIRGYIVHPFLTHSQLLPIQLSDPALRNIMLTQFWVVAHHLMSQVPPLRAQLQTLLTSAEHLFPDRQLVTWILGSSETQWRTWKQNKCVPDLERLQQRPISVIRAGKRRRSAVEEVETSFEWMGKDLEVVSSQMQAAVPSLKGHLEEYVEALDPDSGIEAEYHPKNNAMFTWRTLRLLASDHLAYFGHIQPNGDFEGMVRHIYQTEHGVDIPGVGPVPYHDVDGGEDDDKPVTETSADPGTNCDVFMVDASIVGKDDGNGDVDMKGEVTIEKEVNDKPADTPEGGDVKDIETGTENGAALNGIQSANGEPRAVEGKAISTSTDKMPHDALAQNETHKSDDALIPPKSDKVLIPRNADDERMPTKADLEIMPPKSDEAQMPLKNEKRVASTCSVTEKAKTPLPAADSRPRDGGVRSRSGNGQQHRPEGRDFGGARREPSHDPLRRDDRRADILPRRDDRRGIRDTEPRRDGRFGGGDGEPRRDEWRGDRGGDRGEQQGTGEREARGGGRRGGRSSSGRR